MMILFKKTGEKGFRRACLSGKSVSLHVLVYSENENYRKILLYYFSCKWAFFIILCFLFCIFLSVVATIG